jgi:hypothetical protein
MSLVDSALAGGFFTVSGTDQFPVYTAAALTVDPAGPVAVPAPAAAWLLLSGLGGVFGFGRKAKSAKPLDVIA